MKIVRPKQQAADEDEFDEDDGYGEGFDRTRLTANRNISPRMTLRIAPMRTASNAPSLPIL